jgi:FAD:protein FMN transferase
METLSMNNLHPAGWHNHSFRAMGCEMSVWLETASAGAAAKAFDQAVAIFAAYEQALSRFRPDSELSQLNARSGRWVVVSDLLWDVLQVALEMAALTNGRFDPTTLRALERYGYTVTFEQINRAGPDNHNPVPLSFPGNWMDIALDDDRQAVYLPQGMGLDLGGIAKGYTAQKAAGLVRALGPCLIDAGGDLAAGDAPQGYPGWPVAVSAPWPGDGLEPLDLCKLWLANQAIATSGIDYRTWERDGRLVHHLIDPASGAPAVTDGLTVTVLAADAARAEAWATAALVAGSEEGMDALLERELAALMVTQSGAVLLTSAMHKRLQPLPAG